MIPRDLGKNSYSYRTSG